MPDSRILQHHLRHDECRYRRDALYRRPKRQVARRIAEFRRFRYHFNLMPDARLIIDIRASTPTSEREGAGAGEMLMLDESTVAGQAYTSVTQDDAIC